MEYKVIRSNRCTLSVEITPQAEILVRAPHFCTNKMINSFLESRTDWLEGHIAIQKHRQEAYPEPDEETRLRLIRQAKELLPRLTRQYAEIMGLEPTGVTITGAKKRFGSCSASNKICYSWRLMQYHPEAIEYVVVHELAHIKEKNHGRSFYAVVEKVMPNYKKCREMLKR